MRDFGTARERGAAEDQRRFASNAVSPQSRPEVRTPVEFGDGDRPSPTAAASRSTANLDAGARVWIALPGLEHGTLG
jgi:hypothetical protein